MPKHYYPYSETVITVRYENGSHEDLAVNLREGDRVSVTKECGEPKYGIVVKITALSQTLEGLEMPSELETVESIKEECRNLAEKLDSYPDKMLWIRDVRVDSLLQAVHMIDSENVERGTLLQWQAVRAAMHVLCSKLPTSQ